MEQRTKRAVVVGAVGSTEVVLDAFAQAQGWEVALVVTLPLELSSRHSDFVDLGPQAETLGAEVFRTGKTNDPQTLDAIREARPDYIFVVGWSQLCGSEFLGIRPGKVIGYHPAALPRLRGRAALPWTILLDEKITAGSLFWMEEGTDDGDILAQSYFHLAPDETAAQLYEKHMVALREMLEQCLPLLADGNEPRRVQDERYATWAAKRTARDGLIDWKADAAAIDRLVRAVGRPYPGAFTNVGGDRLVIWSSEPVLGGRLHHAAPGQIVEREGDRLTVQTGSGLLRILEWECDSVKPLRMHEILGRDD
ncbi:methionyl-tRNA formyltransferase [Qipengyuania gelatinilytica]|uniref:Methionyl-tRNA formyltransferase n=1 Tax=Qipengyuania gelatinilytica TaxID=2867231 RepID=A0ABX9A369_9SPHN|nr:methionyl-tRNA formyltransferase [Qipengyuania gelatinilytica]QZD95720.1 methionyl-tRNA formyltransferase [Qipengyuania gelatinilytica]